MIPCTAQTNTDKLSIILIVRLTDSFARFSLSVFVCAVQGIGVIYNMNDPWLLGPYFSMSLLSLVYGMGIALILLPLQARLNIKIQEFISEKE